MAEPPQPLLGHRGLGCRPPRVGFVRQQPPADEGETGRCRRARRDQRALRQGALGLADVVTECFEVQPVEGELVARIRALDAVRSEDRTHPADQDGELLRGPGGCGVAPETFGQVVDADRPAVVERQDLEQRALLTTAQCGQVVPLHLELAQQPHPEAHHAPILPAGTPGGALTCLAVEGRFLQADDVAGLRAQALRAVDEETGVVFVDDGPLGDPLVLLAGLCPSVPRVLLGARLGLQQDGRHPALLARDVTSLDLVCGGRSVVCFAPPFDDRLIEAIALCRALWREGRAASGGPCYPVQDAVNRPCPDDPGPRVALDLTGGAAPPDTVVAAVDLLVRPTGDPTVWRVERP